MSDQINKSSEIKFTVHLDENDVPMKIDWEAEDGNVKSRCKAMMVSMWDEKEENTLRMDLWTKEMKVDEMKQFFHQSLVTMADTFKRATGEEKIVEDMRDFTHYFAEKMGLVEPQ